MIDYYDKVRLMKDRELLDEIDNLTKRIVSATPGSVIYNQLVEYYHTANDAYQELLMTQGHSNEKDEVINIGDIEEKVYMPDYSRKELLDAVVDQYVSDPKKG
jgi:hypothetical protein